MKTLQIFLLLSLLSIKGYCQYGFIYNDTIPVVVAGDTLELAWAGGLNCPQFSAIDLNGDGIKDLVIFDRTGNKVITFINKGTANQISYVYAPQYQRLFPQDMHDWALMRDYNCDGDIDIFTYNNGGIRVYRNDYAINNQLSFSLACNEIYSTQFANYTNLYVSPANIPAIGDINGDGDIDVISFDVGGSLLNYHENQRVEHSYSCDSLNYSMSTACWGNVSTNWNANYFNLGVSCRMDTHGGNSQSDTMPSRHSGGTLLDLDLNNDGDKDLIVGDLISNSADALFNGGNAAFANITSQDSLYPVNNVSVNVNTFPACFYLDVNNDGKRDLICAPNASGVSENNHGVWYYKNVGSDLAPDFKLQTNAFLQNQMIEVGEGSAPVFFDYDNDGLQDLVVGTFGYFVGASFYNARLNLYKNTGTINHPAFTLVDTNYANLSNLNFRNFRPTFGDLDGDGDPDMIVGESNGSLIYLPDTTTGGYPAQYGAPVLNYQGSTTQQCPVPQLVDLNHDNLLDMVIGTRNGKLRYYQNTGTTTNPIFTFITDTLGGVNVRQTGYVTGYAQPFLFDSAGSWRLMVGSERGYVYYYNNITGNLASNFNLVDSMFNYRYMNGFDGQRCTVWGADIDGDGKMDLAEGNIEGGVGIFTTGHVNVAIASPEQTFKHLRIFPNPTNDLCTIDFTSFKPEVADLYIYDDLGRIIETLHPLTTGHYTISTKSFADGIYFYNLRTVTSGMYAGKIMVNR